MKLTSFVAWDPATERPVDTATLTFLDAGDRPLLVTLGSNGAIDPGDFFDHAARVALDACQTVLVVTGPSPARHNLAGLAGVHVTDYAPFSTVMARCRAAIHHAGVGATVAAIRAGIPQVAVPRGFDQPDTAARIEALGIGVSVPWPRRHRHLAAALHRVLSEPDFHERAVTLGAKVRHEDGAAFTADVIQTHLA